MNWDDLRILVTLGREGTLAASARRLGVDQTTVARRLRGLEKELGAALFEHGDGQWRPTPVGRQVLEQAGRIEEGVAGLVRLAEAGAEEVRGVVRVTAVDGLISEWLVPHLPALFSRYPDLSVDLLASNDNLNVARREADIAIRLARPVKGDLLIRKLADVGYAVYGPASGAGDRAVPGAGAWVAYNDDLAQTPEMRYLEARRVDADRIGLRSNNLRALARAAADGLGRAVLPCFIGDGLPGLERCSGPAPVLARELWMVIHPGARPQPRVAAVADWLQAQFAEEQARFAGDAAAARRSQP